MFMSRFWKNLDRGARQSFSRAFHFEPARFLQQEDGAS